jgi:hypothetical protein
VHTIYKHPTTRFDHRKARSEKPIRGRSKAGSGPSPTEVMLQRRPSPFQDSRTDRRQSQAAASTKRPSFSLFSASTRGKLFRCPSIYGVCRLGWASLRYEPGSVRKAHELSVYDFAIRICFVPNSNPGRPTSLERSKRSRATNARSG